MENLPEIGSRVRVYTEKKTYEGQLLASESEVVVLKLDSGYNVGILPQHITGHDLLETPMYSVAQTAEVVQDEHLPTIALLHTGGTIASRVDYKTGGVVADFDPATLLALFPELKEIAHIQSTFLGNMFSDDFRFAHFNKIAAAIYEQHQKGQKKFIVTSGTDFLHYLSAGLAFLMKDKDVSILVVGSQRSSDRGSSDAGMNLVCAAQFLVSTAFTGVGVCMHATSNDTTCAILPGVNARKMHASRRDAFQSINAAPLAYVDYQTKEVELLQELRTVVEINETQHYFNEALKIGLFYSHPQMFAEELLAYKNFDGLVIAGSGLGHLPCTTFDEHTQEHTAVHETLKELAQNMPLVMSTQTLHGKVNLHVYSQGRKILAAGVRGNYSAMTPETTFMKLAYLLSTGQKLELLDQNLVGEQDVETYSEFAQ